MVKRVVIPTEDNNGLKAKLSGHFGRALYFTIVELDDDDNISNVQVILNESEHFGGTGRPPDKILQLKPHALIVYGMGPRALSIFQQAGVAVLRAHTNTVEETIEAYKKNKLEELTEGCHHASHQL